jgi:hypothetical protein
METTSDFSKFASCRRGKVRMAYALNNLQPVRCTIISDQPLFYMDFDGEIDEEVFELGADQNALAIATPETLPQAEKSARTMQAFLAEAASMTDVSGACSHSFDSTFEVALLTRTLEKSRVAAAFLETMAQYQGRFVMNDQVETAAYDRASGHIFLNPNLARTEQILLAARELRRLWQHRNGALIDPLTFHPDQAVLINRAQIADMISSMVRIAWELQLAGEKDMWLRIENSPMEDLARAFAREAFLDFRTINNGTACSAVFEAWFLSERCGSEDRRLIQQMLADYQGYVFDPEHGSKAITAELIGALGSMPFGKNYLAPYVNTIVNDALFTEVRDRSNANFLWFIKFERSFKETERELQNCDTVDTPDGSVRAQNKKTKRFGDHEATAEIISLPQGRDSLPMDGRAVGNGLGLSARIIQFKSALGRGAGGGTAE